VIRNDRGVGGYGCTAPQSLPAVWVCTREHLRYLSDWKGPKIPGQMREPDHTPANSKEAGQQLLSSWRENSSSCGSISVSTHFLRFVQTSSAHTLIVRWHAAVLLAMTPVRQEFARAGSQPPPGKELTWGTALPGACPPDPSPVPQPGQKPQPKAWTGQGVRRKISGGC